MKGGLMLYSILGIIGTIIIGFIVSLWLPGIERKFVHARIQQRIGPPISSPGIMAPIKFFFKQSIKPYSPVPRLYNSLPLVGLLSALLILLFIIPETYPIGALASIVAIVGFLKIEEVVYVFMGSLSKSVMSLRMPFPDLAKGAKHPNVQRSFLEDISAMRAFRLIAFGSFPIYIALFIPVIISKSIFLGDIVAYQQTHGPILLSAAGVIGAIVFFIGYMILLNEYPFVILKTKADVIEGPYLEYAAKSRAFVYITRGFLMFTLAALFSVLFLGIPPNIFTWGILVNILVAIIFPLLMASLSAFAPIFTFKQFYPVTLATSILGVVALLAAFI
ncbi:MAG TPA: NADH-quinone oxidoreductase subunit H [Methanothermobacter sp.]|nr:NADH-quinone oxidoreductase subunit M [Methanothermobacter sp.]HOK72131.1 NADH-quinone oxidoreductase subunit H [Methanothermobacter sp.]HOL68444.1 NADH-quinone oxidoreductase subunit H [Methanothermobacter sp.]HPQ04202.1 NADH-quinone oxidoreductase subunit H [Methanothermobacter sp.]HPU37286.1 NADH-quinone oxidoreductase subunit H [Methanothermobacter sp.]